MGSDGEGEGAGALAGRGISIFGFGAVAGAIMVSPGVASTEDGRDGFAFNAVKRAEGALEIFFGAMGAEGFVGSEMDMVNALVASLGDNFENSAGVAATGGTDVFWGGSGATGAAAAGTGAGVVAGEAGVGAGFGFLSENGVSIWRSTCC